MILFNNIYGKNLIKASDSVKSFDCFSEITIEMCDDVSVNTKIIIIYYKLTCTMRSVICRQKNNELWRPSIWPFITRDFNINVSI